MMIRFRDLTVCLGILSSVLSANSQAAVSECSKQIFSKLNDINGTITKVVDGDTVGILFRGEDFRIRMVGIDTPETNFRGKSQGYWGEAAKENLERLLPVGTRIHVELAGEKCDAHGRILGEVTIDGSSLNERQLKEGLAVNYCIYPDEGCREKSDIIREAIQKGKGFFGGKPRLDQLPYQWRDTVRGTAPHRYIGNLRTYKVYRPGSFRSVPVADRIFFETANDVVPPYHLID
jgi:endonuclease YncB( thermonuclease family)